MRFIAGAILNQTIVARDAGNVIIFCGAGEQEEAHLPSFACLARKVIKSLGAARDGAGPSPIGARSRFRTDARYRWHRGHGSGVRALLQQEFEISDVRAAVAEAIRPAQDAKLDVHRVLLDLATARAVTRLVTTNFDLLLEACNPDLLSSGPPSLPDPHSDRDFRGVVHLHGRVDADYRYAQDEEFVVSSADFGRAYLQLAGRRVSSSSSCRGSESCSLATPLTIRLCSIYWKG